MTTHRASAFEDPTVYGLALGQAVRQLRELRKMSQSQLAVTVGLSQPALSRLEAGNGRVDAFTLTRLAGALGVSVDQLNARIIAALTKAQHAAGSAVSASPGISWWDGAIAVAGALGFAGLLGFAVAAALSEDDTVKSGPIKSTRKKGR